MDMAKRCPHVPTILAPLAISWHRRISAGIICFLATGYLKRSLKIDDSLDVFPVHGVGGILGTTLTGVFVASSLGGAGLAEGVSMGGQVVTQLIGVVATLVWTGVVTFVILKVVDAIVGLRVSEEEELHGLDVMEHGAAGYSHVVPATAVSGPLPTPMPAAILDVTAPPAGDGQGAPATTGAPTAEGETADVEVPNPA